MKTENTTQTQDQQKLYSFNYYTDMCTCMGGDIDGRAYVELSEAEAEAVNAAVNQFNGDPDAIEENLPKELWEKIRKAMDLEAGLNMDADHYWELSDDIIGYDEPEDPSESWFTKTYEERLLEFNKYASDGDVVWGYTEICELNECDEIDRSRLTRVVKEHDDEFIGFYWDDCWDYENECGYSDDDNEEPPYSVDGRHIRMLRDLDTKIREAESDEDEEELQALTLKRSKLLAAFDFSGVKR